MDSIVFEQRARDSITAPQLSLSPQSVQTPKSSSLFSSSPITQIPPVAARRPPSNGDVSSLFIFSCFSANQNFFS
ncbi:unnamed protein product [Prunus armeniaca]